MPIRTDRIWLVTGLICLIAGGTASYLRTHDAASRAFLDARKGGTIRSGVQYQLVFVGASWCKRSNDRSVIHAVNLIADSLRKRAKLLDATFATRGIAVDWDVGQGLAYLNRVGSFDEVAVGHNWLNASSLELMVRRQGGVLATPQIVLLAREVFSSGRVLRVGDDQILADVYGVNQIDSLLNRIGVVDLRVRRGSQVSQGILPEQ